MTKDSSYTHLGEMPASHVAAQHVVPVILSLMPAVRSVVDIGGGDGGWLRVFQAQGVDKIWLIDHPSVAPHVVIDEAFFSPCDLRRALPPPSKFDLAVCLECAEHLPMSMAEPLVDWLTKCADSVVFSAAIPGQGGNGHVHLRFPRYWARLFLKRGYKCYDLLRPKILFNQQVAWWYRQNMFIFATESARISTMESRFIPEDFDLVHRNVSEAARSFKTAAGDLLPTLVMAIQRRLRLRSRALKAND